MKNEESVKDSTFLYVDVWKPEGADDAGGHRHTVIGDLRAPGTGFDDEANYDCREELRGEFPDVMFDPEHSCFYAYARTGDRAAALAARIDKWVTNRRGTI